ncbi:DUF4752 family protein [Enterobacter roggenkampii]|uniref:DUF4752 family protein n=1 Tax=Enterobacter roggenkampii TaxID=1812935 RepID=UPI002FEE9E58
MSFLDSLNTGLALMGWLFIMFKTGQWFISIALKQWDKRRKLSRRQKAVNEFYDAFDLSKAARSEILAQVAINGKGVMTDMVLNALNSAINDGR